MRDEDSRRGGDGYAAPQGFAEWVQTVPNEIRSDPLWRVAAYRLSLFLSDLAWEDAGQLAKEHRLFTFSDQLLRAVGSISSNLAEGYSRGTGKDRARFYEYALGSARESRDWYLKARHALGVPVSQERLKLVTRVIQLLLKMVPDQRQKTIRESAESYDADASVTPLTPDVWRMTPDV